MGVIDDDNNRTEREIFNRLGRDRDVVEDEEHLGSRAIGAQAVGEGSQQSRLTATTAPGENDDLPAGQLLLDLTENLVAPGQGPVMPKETLCRERAEVQLRLDERPRAARAEKPRRIGAPR